MRSRSICSGAPALLAALALLPGLGCIPAALNPYARRDTRTRADKRAEADYETMGRADAFPFRRAAAARMPAHLAQSRKFRHVQPAKLIEGLRLTHELDSEPVVRQEAAAALYGVSAADQERLRQEVLKSLKEGDKTLRCNAATALGASTVPEVVPSLVEALSDKNEKVRAAAARSLGRMGFVAFDSLGALKGAQADKSKKVLREATEAARKVDVLGALSNRKRDVRRTAAHFLFEHPRPEAVDPLIGALADRDHWVRYYAAYAVTGCGPGAARAVPELKKLLADRKASVRAAAADSLRRIESGKKPRKDMIEVIVPD